MRAFWFICFVASFVLVWFFLSLQVHAHTADRPDLDDWFAGLRSEGGGLCCSFADGHPISPDDVDVKDGHWTVRVDGKWLPVPDNVVLTVPNKFGQPLVWLYPFYGETKIRCFLPGAGS